MIYLVRQAKAPAYASDAKRFFAMRDSAGGQIAQMLTLSASGELPGADESKIVDELNSAQGAAMELGGYYFPSEEKVQQAMRSSETFNQALARLS